MKSFFVPTRDGTWDFPFKEQDKRKEKYPREERIVRKNSMKIDSQVLARISL